MYVNELAPKNDILKFIPDYLLSDELPPQTFYSMERFLNEQGLRQRDYIGFITGAAEMQETIFKSYRMNKDELPKDDRATWFSTDKVEDVRIFFRTAKQDPSHSIGSKMRLYSWGQPYGKTDKYEIAHLDSGFLTFSKSYFDIKMVHQKALASTMLYHSLYSIGGPASVRKINVPAGKDAVAPSYKMLSSIKASYNENLDKKRIDHILTPAGIAAGIEDPKDFFGEAVLDKIANILFEAKDINDVRDTFLNLPDIDLFEEDVDRIIDRSNNKEANLSNSSDFDEAPGINIVATLDELANILDEF